jgi:WG containing repeat
MKSRIFAFLLATITFSTCIITFNLSSSLASVQVGIYGYVNKTGRLVIKSQYSEVKNFSQGLAAVKIGDKWGYIDRTGKVIVKPQYSEVLSFSQGLAAVKLDDKWGYVDRTGKVIVKPQFSEAYSFFEGLAAIQIDGERRYSYIDKRGIVIKPQPGSGYSFMTKRVGFSDSGAEYGVQQEVIVVKPDSEYSFMELGGSSDSNREIISYIYDFSEGLAAVETRDGDGTCGAVLCLFGYVDKTGKMVIEAEFYAVKEFSKGLAAVSIHDLGGGADIGEWGYINKQGQMVIKALFSDANSFSQGLAAVESGRKYVLYEDEESGETFRKDIAGKWGYIDRTGKQIISSQFDLANSFSEGLAAVKVKNKCGYINKTGKVIVKRRFSTCEHFSEGLAAVKTSIK